MNLGVASSIQTHREWKPSNEVELVRCNEIEFQKCDDPHKN